MRGVLQDDGFDPETADRIITIAMTDYAAFVLLPPLLARLAIEAHGFDVRVRGIFGKDEVIDLLDSGETSLAISVPVDASGSHSHAPASAGGIHSGAELPRMREELLAQDFTFI